MKAIIWTKYGEPEVLQVKEIEKPSPKDNEVLVKIHATAATTGDARMRALRVPRGFGILMRLAFGFTKPKKQIPGMDFSGEIESIGSSVTQFSIGDRVCGSTGMNLGANSEYTCLSHDGAIVKIPEGVSYEDAVAIIFGGVTALHFLRDKVKIQGGQKVLINGASGAVGTAAVQLAKYYGAEVTGVCSATNTELLKSIGADRVVVYENEQVIKGGENYDIILDTIGNLTFQQCKKSLSRQGKLIQISADLFTILGSLFNPRMICGVAGESKESLELLVELVNSGKIKPVIDSVHPLEDIVKVHRHIDQGHKRGNMVLVV